MKVRLISETTIGAIRFPAGQELEVDERVGGKLIDRGIAVFQDSGAIVITAPEAIGGEGVPSPSPAATGSPYGRKRGLSRR